MDRTTVLSNLLSFLLCPDDFRLLLTAIMVVSEESLA